METQRLTPEVAEEAYNLMTPTQRRDFIIFTLRQRQPYLCSLLEKAGIDATAVAALDWTNLLLAVQTLDAAKVAAEDARDTAWDVARDTAWAAVWATWNTKVAAGDVSKAVWNTKVTTWDAVWAARNARDAASDATTSAAWEAAKREQHDYYMKVLLGKEVNYGEKRV